MDLILRTANGDFDLFGNESIVQTLGIFSFEDITSRSGEYTNVFNLPLTNNNRKLIEYADFIPSINTAPYKKINLILIVGGIEFKNGFLVIDSINDVIKARFFSGNTNFYELLKSIYLTDLDWSDLNHTWNYANAIASSANNGGYIYPVIDYGGQTLTGDIVDIRKILPTTFVKTILVKIFEYTDYQYIDDFDRTDLNKSVIPYSKKNPTVSTEYLLLSSVDVIRLNDYTISTITKIVYPFSLFNQTFLPCQFTGIATPGSSTNYDFINNKYTAQYSGNYTITATLPVLNPDVNMSCYFNSVNVVQYTFACNIYLSIAKVSNTSTQYLKSELLSTNNASYNNTALPVSSVTPITTVSTGATIVTVEAYLTAGESISVGLLASYNCSNTHLGQQPVTTYITLNPTFTSTVNLTVDLSPELIFGGLITYSSILPKIKASDFLKDISIRFGLILNINEDTKTVTISKIDKLTDNIPNSLNWSNKLDESDLPELSFKFDNYAQNNLFQHKVDNSVLKLNPDADYNLTIDNANLELSKDFYTSPFSQSENIDFDGTLTTYINLYDVNTNKFDNDVNYRICFSEAVTGLFKFTDGTSTSGYINTKRVYFIDYTLPTLSMGFGIGLIPKNSQTLVSTLQNIRIVKANFNLNINDIKSIDWLTPVYIEQFQSYFFVTSINQFNYTNPDLTEVELIKLNP